MVQLPTMTITAMETQTHRDTDTHTHILILYHTLELLLTSIGIEIFIEITKYLKLLLV